MERASKIKLFGFILAGFILMTLIISVPARAFTLNLSMDNNDVEMGQIVNFDASITINSNENLPISKLVFELDGDKKISCEFTVDGIVLSGCKGITIKPAINSTKAYGSEYGNYNGVGYNFGYGYGYKYGKLLYHIALDTDYYNTGDYASKLNVYIGDKIFSQTGETLTINSGGSYSEGYSSKKKMVCVNGWHCSEWSTCEDGKQTRTCEMIPNCYLENKPFEERLCVEDIQIRDVQGNVKILQLSSGLAEKEDVYIIEQKPENKQYFGESLVLNDENKLFILMISIIVLILILLILILIVIAVKRARRRAKIRRERKHLRKIMYRPGK
jgi:hypothetical protein